MISDSSELSTGNELQVAVGDPRLSIKGGDEMDSGLALGGPARARVEHFLELP